MKHVIVIHGPNLNMLGTREVEQYGTLTLSEINRLIEDQVQDPNISLQFFQSNSEAEIIDQIQTGHSRIDYGIINPGAFTHYSVAIRDAISSVDTTYVEVHLSNIDARESFRRISLTSPVCIGSITGFGAYGYVMAINFIQEKIRVTG